MLSFLVFKCELLVSRVLTRPGLGLTERVLELTQLGLGLADLDLVFAFLPGNPSPPCRPSGSRVSAAMTEAMSSKKSLVCELENTSRWGNPVVALFPASWNPCGGSAPWQPGVIAPSASGVGLVSFPELFIMPEVEMALHVGPLMHCLLLAASPLHTPWNISSWLLLLQACSAPPSHNSVCWILSVIITARGIWG